MGKKSKAAAATSTRRSRYREIIGKAELRNQSRVLLACAPAATSVHAREFILVSSLAEVVWHLACLHALEVSLHAGV